MNKNSNLYIITYATVMVVVVAIVLAVASLSLQDRQAQNVTVEKKGDILHSIGMAMNSNDVADKTAFVDEQYKKYIVESFVVDFKGNIVEGADAFTMLKMLKAEYQKPIEQRQLPLFVADVDGTRLYILPLWGKGLWGPVWGYAAFEKDWSTVFGVVFDHKGETPGLGAEITTQQFCGQFKGKSIFKDNALAYISVLKGAGSSEGNNNAVDAISGGTITSRGVEDMIKNSLDGYKAYILKMRASANAEPQAAPALDSLTVNTPTNEQ